MTQRADESLSLDDAFARAWRALSVLPRRELTMIPADTLDASYRPPDRPDADEG